jgi:hypothetical protein
MLMITHVTAVVNIFFVFVLKNLLLFEKGVLEGNPFACWIKLTGINTLLYDNLNNWRLS